MFAACFALIAIINNEIQRICPDLCDAVSLLTSAEACTRLSSLSINLIVLLFTDIVAKILMYENVSLISKVIMVAR